MYSKATKEAAEGEKEKEQRRHRATFQRGWFSLNGCRPVSLIKTVIAEHRDKTNAFSCVN